MHVKSIIAEKKIQQTITIKPDDLVKTAAEILAKHRIGAVVVSRDGAIVDGILSERDIVRAIGTAGVSCMDLKADELMTHEVIACHPEDTATSVMERMTEGRFRHMPVVDGGSMVGVISIGDVVKARMSEIELENRAMEDMIKGM